MLTVYDTSVEVGKPGAGPGILDLVEAAYEDLDRVSRRETGVSLGAADRLDEEFALLPGGPTGPRLQCLQRDLVDRKAVALRYEGRPTSTGRPDRQIDVVVSGWTGDDRPCCRVSVRARAADHTVPGQAPGLLAKLARTHGISWKGWEYPCGPERVGVDEVRSVIVPRILAADRPYPLVLVAPINLTGKPYRDPDALHEALMGVAQVVVMETPRATYPVAELLGSGFACYKGAVRAYFPGFQLSDWHGDHPLWSTPEQTAAADFGLMVTERIARWRSAEFGRNSPDWEILADFSLRRAGDDDAEAAVVVLDREQRLRARIDELEDELQRERTRNVTLGARIRELEDRLTDAVGETDASGPMPGPLSGVAAVVHDEVAASSGRLALALNSRSELDRYPFEDEVGLRAAFRWLRTTYWEARLGARSEPDLDGTLRDTAPGFWYRPHQSEATKGRYPEYYEAAWEGRGYDLDAHLGRGASRDPRRSIRVGFAVDEERRAVVIGYIGQHQKTDTT